ncbi:hypothetical protein COU61_01530 [Candidatus Pacearchaeota archaeon CG10_big_fil_rev_8_21_14_0_10_35_13]|nr:MAG: hypothetical protein COU61_01530 [Candidatus Pacearchaeota archaeon CG10_big_fil_rev_8_21_14_0_10_35_13]
MKNYLTRRIREAYNDPESLVGGMLKKGEKLVLHLMPAYREVAVSKRTGRLRTAEEVSELLHAAEKRETRISLLEEELTHVSAVAETRAEAINTNYQKFLEEKERTNAIRKDAVRIIGEATAGMRELESEGAMVVLLDYEGQVNDYTPKADNYLRGDGNGARGIRIAGLCEDETDKKELERTLRTGNVENPPIIVSFDKHHGKRVVVRTFNIYLGELRAMTYMIIDEPKKESIAEHLITTAQAIIKKLEGMVTSRETIGIKEEA